MITKQIRFGLTLIRLIQLCALIPIYFLSRSCKRKWHPFSLFETFIILLVFKCVPHEYLAGLRPIAAVFVRQLVTFFDSAIRLEPSKRSIYFEQIVVKLSRGVDLYHFTTLLIYNRNIKCAERLSISISASGCESAWLFPNSSDIETVTQWNFTYPFSILTNKAKHYNAYFTAFAHYLISENEYNAFGYALLEACFSQNPNPEHMDVAVHSLSHGKKLLRRGELEKASRFCGDLSSILPAHFDGYANLYSFMTQLRRDMQEELPAISMGDPTLLLSYSVWGKQYTQLFLNYCLPSLLADGNLPQVRRSKRILMDLYSTARDFKTITSSKVFKKLAGICEVNQIEIPENILGSMVYKDHPTTFVYDIYGGFHHMSMERARLLGADLFALGPDNVYSEGTLGALTSAGDNGSDVVFFSATRVQAESILPVLDTFISEERTKLSIGDDQLIYEATQHVHHSFLKYFVTDKKSVGWRSGFFFVKKDGIAVRNFHIHPAIITGRALLSSDNSKWNYSTLDETTVVSMFPKVSDWKNFKLISEAAGFLMLDITFKKDHAAAEDEVLLDEHYLNNLMQNFETYHHWNFCQKLQYKFPAEKDYEIRGVRGFEIAANGKLIEVNYPLNREMTEVEKMTDIWARKLAKENSFE